jgi:hypothetical protein
MRYFVKFFCALTTIPIKSTILLSSYMSESLERIAKIKNIILWSVIGGGFISLFIPTLVNGQTDIDVCGRTGGCLKGTDTLADGASQDTVVDLLIVIAQWLTYVSAGVAVLVGVVAGIQIMTSNGDTTKYQKGLKTLQYAVIGLVIAVVAYTVVAIITTLLGTASAS